MGEQLVVLSVLLLLTGLWLLRQAERQHQRSGLPQGRVIYADTGTWNRVEQPLFSPRHRLTGRPDYLLRDKRRIIPVEIKSGAAPPQPYPSHILQLAAYGLLVQEAYHAPPPYGLIHYRDCTFAVDLTPDLQAWLLETLDEMRQAAVARDVSRSHDNPAQCAACGYRPFCDQSLA